MYQLSIQIITYAYAKAETSGKKCTSFSYLLQGSGCRPKLCKSWFIGTLSFMCKNSRGPGCKLKSQVSNV